MIEDEEKPPLPSFPNYDGLSYKAVMLPVKMMDISFPPEQGLVNNLVPISNVPSFDVVHGLMPPRT